MLTNFHTHTKRCLHAYGTEEDYIKAAVSEGLVMLGFSDHAPFPDYDFGMRMPYSELDDYISTLDILKEKYKNKIKLFRGLEIEYHAKYLDYYHSLLDEKGFDYLALGQHIYTTPSGRMDNIFSAGSTEDYLIYAETVCEAIETGLFRFVAHPDVMFINNNGWDNNCEKACELITECAAKNNAILEFNANGIRRNKRLYKDGVRYPYPHISFWQKAKTLGIKVIVGSDCHTPDQVYDEYTKYAVQMADKLGLKRIENIFEE